MPIGGYVILWDCAAPDQLAHWLIVESCLRAVMQGPLTGHVNRHHWKRQWRAAMVEDEA